MISHWHLARRARGELLIVLTVAAVPVGAQVTIPAAHPNGTATAMPVAPPGPPPTNLAVHSSGAGIQVVSWSKPQLNGVTFNVLRQILPNQEWKRLTRTPLSYAVYNDTTVLTPNTTTYRVVALYADGRQGTAEVLFPDPATMQSPAGLTGSQVGEARVYLHWQPVANASGYVIFGPGQPSNGKIVTRNDDTLSGVPLGSQSFRVVTSYYTATSALNDAPLIALNVVRWTAQYRVLLLGFHVNHPTQDDALDRDGHSDEVYGAAHVMLFSRATPGGSTVRPNFDRDYVVKSMVYGDNSKWPYRIKAGTVLKPGDVKPYQKLGGLYSGVAGLVAGDEVPANPQTPVSSPNGVQFPMQVWAGTITANNQFIVIAPTLWEQDGDTTQVRDWWQGQRDMAPKLEPSYVQAAQQNNAITFDYLFNNVNGRPSGHTVDAGNGFDRAIGMSYAPNGGTLLDRGIILTQEKLERALAAANSSRVVVPIHLKEDNTGDPGDYLLYIQVERVP